MSLYQTCRIRGQ